MAQCLASIIDIVFGCFTPCIIINAVAMIQIIPVVAPNRNKAPFAVLNSTVRRATWMELCRSRNLGFSSLLCRDIDVAERSNMR